MTNTMNSVSINTMVGNIDTPYGIRHFTKFAFINPEFFDKELSHSFRYGSMKLIVADTKAIRNALNDDEKAEYEQFIKDFADMYACPNDCRLCYVVGEEVKYFHIGIYSNTDNLPWEEKDVWLDKHNADWMKEVEAYTAILKKYASDNFGRAVIA